MSARNFIDPYIYFRTPHWSLIRHSGSLWKYYIIETNGACFFIKIFLFQSPSQRNNDKDNDRLSNNNIKIPPVATPSQTTPPASPQQATASRRLLQDTLSRGSPYPMIAIPDKGYWVDGTDHDCQYDNRGMLVMPLGTWRAKFETDDTAKCYRRFFVGRVSKNYTENNTWTAFYVIAITR